MLPFLFCGDELLQYIKDNLTNTLFCLISFSFVSADFHGFMCHAEDEVVAVQRTVSTRVDWMAPMLLRYPGKLSRRKFPQSVHLPRLGEMSAQGSLIVPF